MLSYPIQHINKYSAYYMVLACFIGFFSTTVASAVLSVLPQVLFFLMCFTLLGINQKQLLRALCQPVVWRYGVFHSVGMTVVFVGLAYLLGARGDLLLAIAAMMATGALFGTSAIVRSMGFLPMYAMALTIASTLLMPLVLYVNLMLFQTGAVELDLVLYSKRLLIFLVGPMLLSAVVHHFFTETQLHRVHSKLSRVTILLVMAFPIGLSGAFRGLVDVSPWSGLMIFLMGVVLCLGLFALTFYVYRKQSFEQAISAAVASGGRNALLTFTIAAPFVGSDFMPLVGAMQLPIYAMPLLTRAWLAWRER